MAAGREGPRHLAHLSQWGAGSPSPHQTSPAATQTCSRRRSSWRGERCPPPPGLHRRTAQPQQGESDAGRRRAAAAAFLTIARKVQAGRPGSGHAGRLACQRLQARPEGSQAPHCTGTAAPAAAEVRCQRRRWAAVPPSSCHWYLPVPQHVPSSRQPPPAGLPYGCSTCPACMSTSTSLQAQCSAAPPGKARVTTVPRANIARRAAAAPVTPPASAFCRMPCPPPHPPHPNALRKLPPRRPAPLSPQTA